MLENVTKTGTPRRLANCGIQIKKQFSCRLDFQGPRKSSKRFILAKVEEVKINPFEVKFARRCKVPIFVRKILEENSTSFQEKYKGLRSSLSFEDTLVEIHVCYLLRLQLRAVPFQVKRWKNRTTPWCLFRIKFWKQRTGETLDHVVKPRRGMLPTLNGRKKPSAFSTYTKMNWTFSFSWFRVFLVGSDSESSLLQLTKTDFFLFSRQFTSRQVPYVAPFAFDIFFLGRLCSVPQIGTNLTFLSFLLPGRLSGADPTPLFIIILLERQCGVNPNPKFSSLFSQKAV